MRRALAQFAKRRRCWNAPHSAGKPIACEPWRGAGVVAAATTRVSDGVGRVGWRDLGGAEELRFFNTRSGEAESGALVSEKGFHLAADDTLNMLQERIEAYGEDLNVDGFDVDSADGVMTVRLGTLGTYVLNKQTPNRQLWLSSPVSGPARFDWVVNENIWVYRRSKAELVSLLEDELSKLLKSPVTLRKLP